MSLAQSAQSTWDRWVKAAEVYRDRRQLIIMLMGYSSGMPFLLTSAVLSYWMTRGAQREVVALRRREPALGRGKFALELTDLIEHRVHPCVQVAG